MIVSRTATPAVYKMMRTIMLVQRLVDDCVKFIKDAFDIILPSKNGWKGLAWVMRKEFENHEIDGQR